MEVRFQMELRTARWKNGISVFIINERKIIDVSINLTWTQSL